VDGQMNEQINADCLPDCIVLYFLISVLKKHMVN
jgi:hypothetical protein